MHTKLSQQHLPHGCKKLDVDRAIVISFWKLTEYFDNRHFHEVGAKLLIRSELGGPAVKNASKQTIIEI